MTRQFVGLGFSVQKKNLDRRGKGKGKTSAQEAVAGDEEQIRLLQLVNTASKASGDAAALLEGTAVSDIANNLPEAAIEKTRVGTTALPAGTKRKEFKGYEQVEIPPPANPVSLPVDQRIPIQSLPEWAQPAFAGATHLLIKHQKHLVIGEKQAVS